VKLTYAESQEPLWLKLRAHLVEQLTDLRLKNENINQTEKEFASTVGQIKLLKRLLDMEYQEKKS
jgi:hypothetical protein